MTDLWLSACIDYGRTLLEHPDAVARISDIMLSPSFAALRRISQRRGDRWLRHTKPRREVAIEYFLDRSTESVSFDNGRSKEVTASAQFEHGPYPVEARGPKALRYHMNVAWPLPQDVDACVRDLAELAHALDATAGFVAVEASHSRSLETALGGRLPRERARLSDQRRRERRGRGWKLHEVAGRVCNVEWLTILGAEHLRVLASAGLSVEGLRETGAFHRVLEVAPDRIVVLRLTENPADDLLEDSFEVKLGRARAVLAPMMLDVSDVDLTPID